MRKGIKFEWHLLFAHPAVLSCSCLSFAALGNKINALLKQDDRPWLQ